MRWLLDQGVGRGAGPLLRAQGHDAGHVGELGLGAAPDPVLLDLATAEHRIVVTRDADFPEALVRQRLLTPSVVRLRWEGLNSAGVVAVLLDVVAQTGTALTDGAIVTVTPKGLRVRRLGDS